MKEITSLQHPLIKYWTKLHSDASFRRAEKRLILEGKNSIQDVLKTQRAKHLIVTSLSLVPPDCQTDEIVLVTEQIAKKISRVESPEGILAELAMPPLNQLSRCSRLLVVDRLQDPGNLGTLIRSALAFGWDGLFLLQGTCDPFNDKALRAAKGATFTLPLSSGSWQDLHALVTTNNLQVVVADLEGIAPKSLSQQNIALVLGNEAQGVKIPDCIKYTKVTLPMKGPMESLNVAVAGSILLYLFQGDL